MSLEKFYDAVQDGTPYDSVVDKAVDVINNGIDKRPEIDVAALTDYSQMKEKLAMEVVSVEANRRFHHAELNTHRVYREVFKGMIEESDKRITPKKWQEELENLKVDYQKNRIRCSDITLHLAKMEVLSYNKRDLERMLENESHQRNRNPGRKRNVVEI